MRSSRFSRPIQSIRGASLPAFAADVAVYAYILLMGGFQFTHYLRTADFVTDATYPDLARSLLDQGTYQLRFLPQTTLPPGLPFILALVGRFAGFTPAVLFPVIAVFTTLGLIAVYELLRRVEGRGVAAVACLLLGSSTSLFVFNTTVIFPEMPFLLASMLALLLTLKVDHTEPDRTPIGWMLVLGVALGLAVLIRSVGIALLLGLVTWIATSLLAVPETGRRRMKRFLIPLALGMAAQLGWSVWAQHHQILEWQLPGYPQSYLSQLKVKNGQYPELGLAHLVDMPSRVGQNMTMGAVRFGELLTGRHISRFWSSPAIAGVLILIAIGLVSSFRSAGHLHDWYFLWYELIYLLWPWETTNRFLFPIVPLACLYLWRGMKGLRGYSLSQPRAVGLCMALSGSFLCLKSAAFASRITSFPVDTRYARMDHLQPIAATFFWGMLAVLGLGMFTFHSLRKARSGAGAFARLRTIAESKSSLLLRLAAIVAFTVLVGSGTSQLVARGRDHMKPDITLQDMYPEMEAAEWIRAYEPSDRVIMAREPDFVFHYTHRRVVWLPPISDPKVLMDGILRYHVGVVVVAHHSNSYWLPPEDACFQFLLQAYPSTFHLSHQGPDYWVYEVGPAPAGT